MTTCPEEFLDDGEDIENETERFSSIPPFLPDEVPEDEDLQQVANAIRARHAARTRTEPKSSPEPIHEVETCLYVLPVAVCLSNYILALYMLLKFGTQSKREADAIRIIQGYISKKRRKHRSTTISSVQSTRDFADQVLVWAQGSRELKHLASQYSFMFQHRVSLIEKHEYYRIFASLDESLEVPVPSWGRIKCGLYKNDLALIERSYAGGYVDVLVAPRLIKREFKLPAPVLIPPSLAIETWGPKAVKMHPSEAHWFTKGKIQIKHALHSRYL